MSITARCSKYPFKLSAAVKTSLSESLCLKLVLSCRIAAHGKKLNRHNVMKVNVVDTW